MITTEAERSWPVTFIWHDPSTALPLWGSRVVIAYRDGGMFIALYGDPAPGHNSNWNDGVELSFIKPDFWAYVPEIPKE